MWSCTLLFVNAVISNCVRPLRLRFYRQWSHLTIVLCKVRILLLAPLIVVHIIHCILVQSIFLLLDISHASLVLAATCSRPMICTYLVVATSAYDIPLIVSKLAWSVNSFLNVGILTLKFFDFSFYNILHKVLLLTHILRFYYLISCFVISRLKVERILWIAVKSIVSNYLVTSIRKLRWRLQADAAWLSAVVERTWAHIVIHMWRLTRTIWMVLNSLSSTAV
jgi:hypothetical protein